MLNPMVFQQICIADVFPGYRFFDTKWDHLSPVYFMLLSLASLVLRVTLPPFLQFAMMILIAWHFCPAYVKYALSQDFHNVIIL